MQRLQSVACKNKTVELRERVVLNSFYHAERCSAKSIVSIEKYRWTEPDRLPNCSLIDSYGSAYQG
jgi:hypothetical protein